MDVKVGDVVHVRGVAESAAEGWVSVNFGDFAHTASGIDIQQTCVVHVEPRPLAVGDKVRELDHHIGEVRAIDGDQVWVLWQSGCRETYLAVNLSRVSSAP